MWDVPETVSKGLAAEDKLNLDSVKVPLRIRQGLGLSLAKWLRLDAENSSSVRNHDAEFNETELLQNGASTSESVLGAPRRDLKSILPTGPTSVETSRKTSTEEVKVIHTGREGFEKRRFLDAGAS
jgi:hypothetical protein